MALPRGNAAVGVAGKINSGEDVRFALEQGADFVLLGRAAILHHDFPKRLAADGNFQAATLPVSRAHLVTEGSGPSCRLHGHLEGLRVRRRLRLP